MSATRERTKLESHEGRKRSLKYVDRGATLQVIAGLSLLALALAAASAWLVRFAILDLRGENPYRREGEDPMWVLGAFGFTVTAFGFGMAAEAVLLRVRARRVRRARERHPAEPWRWDYRWGSGPIRVTGVGYWIANLVALSIPVAFWSLFNLAAWDTWNPLFVLAALTGDAVLLYAFSLGARGLARTLRQRLTTAVHMDSHPCFLGDRLQAELRGTGFRRSPHIRVVLREIEESDEGVFQVYADHRSLDVGDGPLRVAFDLPTGGAPNRLTEWPHHYWELAVETTVYRWVAFLLPVYARPAGA